MGCARSFHVYARYVCVTLLFGNCKLFRKHAKDWSQEAAVIYSRALKQAKYVGALPYNWNDKEQKLEYSKSLTRSAIFFTQYLLYLMYEGFLVYNWISLTFDVNASKKRKDALLYNLLTNMLIIVYQSCSFFHRASLHNLTNRLLSYVREDFQRLHDDGRKQRKIGAFISIHQLVAAAVICLNIAVLFRRPMSPHLLTSLVPDVANRQKWELIPFALIHGYLWCNQWTASLFFCTHAITYTSAMLNALNRTRPNRHLSEERFYRATRKLEVLQGNYNALFRWAWWAVEVVGVTAFVIGICGSIRNDGAQAVRQLFASTLILAGLLKFWKGLGEVFETSSEVHWEWRKRGGLPSSLFKKRIKSMRPIRVEVGGYFYIDASMTLTLLSIISENTCNVLLAA